MHELFEFLSTEKNCFAPHQVEISAYFTHDIMFLLCIWLCRQASNEIREAVTGGSSLAGAGAAEGSRRQGTGADAGNL